MKKTFMSLVSTAFLLCSLRADAPGSSLGKPGTQLETEHKELETSSVSPCLNPTENKAAAPHRRQKGWSVILLVRLPNSCPRLPMSSTLTLQSTKPSFLVIEPPSGLSPVPLQCWGQEACPQFMEQIHPSSCHSAVAPVSPPTSVL